MEKGNTGFITYGEGETTKVEIVEIITYPATGMPGDILFKYADGETKRPLDNPINGADFPLPASLAEMVFTKD